MLQPLPKGVKDGNYSDKLHQEVMISYLKRLFQKFHRNRSGVMVKKS